MTVSVDNVGALLFERNGTEKTGVPMLFPGDELTINVDANGDEKRAVIFDRKHVEVTLVNSGAIGWILEKRLVRDFHPVEPAPSIIDKNLFVAVALSAARVLRVNLHYLLALSHLKSNITDFRSAPAAGVNEERRIGPYAFSLSEWNKSKTDHLYGINYLERDIFDPYAQTFVAAAAIRAQIDLYQKLKGVGSPTLTDVYFWALLPEMVTSNIIKANDNKILKELLLEIFMQDPSIGNEAGNVEILVQRDRELFFDGETPRDIASAKNIAGQRLLKGLDATSTLIDEIPLEEFPGPTAAPTDTAIPAAGASNILMKWGENEYVDVYGHLVAQMQRALNAKLGPTPPLKEDLTWGKNTTLALNGWLTREQKPSSGTLTFSDWRTLTDLGDPDLFDLCAQVTASFEGHGFANPVSNTGSGDPAVLTWGYCGFTFRFGHIQEILRRIDLADQATISEIAGSDAQSLRQMLTTPLSDQLVWAQQNLTPQGMLAPQWKQIFEALGNSPEVQRVQLAYAREVFWEKIALEQARELELIEPLSHALLYDIAVQNNGLQASEMTKIKAAKTGLRSEQGEEKVRALIVETLLDRDSIKNGNFKEAVRGRKRVLTSGIGKKNTNAGRSYHLGYWGLEPQLTIRETGLNDGPADAASIGKFATFEAFFASQLPETAFIQARHFLFKGNRQAASGNLNTNPPEKMWRNIIPVAKLLMELTNTFGNPVIFNSVFRNPAYNKFVGGAPESRHMQFDAVDFTPAPGVTLTQAYNLLDSWRSGSSPKFRGGLRKYDTFIHLDTRGTNKDW